VTRLHGRTFGVFTLMSSTLTFICALNLDNKALYATTFMSFVYGYGHFIIENLVYHTSTAANLGTYAVVAG
jgi:hypothetical protein